MIALLCAAVLLPHDDPKVTLRVPATPLAAILKQVSESTSVPVITDPQFAEIPLVVSVTDVPLSEFLGKVAQSMEMDVRPYNNGFRITRTADHLNKLQEAMRAESEKWWTFAIDKTREAFVKTPWTTKNAEKLIAEGKKFSQEYAAKMKANEGHPSSKEIIDLLQKRKPGVGEFKPSARLAFRIAQAIGAKALSRFPTDRQVVLSRYPTLTQIAAPPQLEQYIAQYVRESALNPHVEEEVPSSDGSGEYLALQDKVEKISGGIGKVLIIVRSSRTPSIEVHIYSKNGMERDDGSFGAMLGFSLPDAFTVERTGEEPKPEKLEPFTPTPLSLQHIKFAADDADSAFSFTDTGLERPNIEIDPELRNSLLSPEKRDPLAYEMSEALLEYAAQKKLNLVFRLDDNMFWLGSFAGTMLDKDGRIKLDQFAPVILQDAKPEAGWLVRGVREPLDFEAAFTSRTALGRFARAVAKSGLTLDAEVDFVASRPKVSSRFMQIDYPVLKVLIIENGLDPWFIFGSRMAMSHFLGSLSQSQRAAATRGGLTAAALSGEQMSRLQYLLFDSEFFGTGRFGGMQHSIIDEATPDVKQEPAYMMEATEALPSGVPPQTLISITTKREEAFRGDDGTQLTAKELAIVALVTSKYANVEGASDILEYAPTKLKPVSIQTYIATITVSKDLKLSEQYEYNSPVGPKAFVGIDHAFIRAAMEPWLKRFASATFEELEEQFYIQD